MTATRWRARRATPCRGWGERRMLRPSPLLSRSDARIHRASVSATLPRHGDGPALVPVRLVVGPDRPLRQLVERLLIAAGHALAADADRHPWAVQRVLVFGTDHRLGRAIDVDGVA